MELVHFYARACARCSSKQHELLLPGEHHKATSQNDGHRRGAQKEKWKEVVILSHRKKEGKKKTKCLGSCDVLAISCGNKKPRSQAPLDGCAHC